MRTLRAALSSSQNVKQLNSPDKNTKPSELFRERLVARYYNATQKLPEFVAIDPSGFVPQSSNDAALTAFAQLAALRLDAKRALISLIDSRNQYVIAEATKTLSMQSDLRHGPNDSLWLGCVTVPRAHSICELVLTASHQADASNTSREESDILILQNLQDHPRMQVVPRKSEASELTFYAGVPIMLLDGTKIGVYSILDDKPRNLSADQKVFLHDMAKTAMEHLEALRLRDERRRSYKLISGLESFIQGLPGLKSILQEPRSRASLASLTKGRTTRDSSVTEPVLPNDGDDPTSAPLSPSAKAGKSPSQTLWELALPDGCKPMFSRAAKIIRQSGEYDGVGFFYISSASNRDQAARQRNHLLAVKRRGKSSSDTSSPSSSPPSSEESDSPQNIQDIIDHESANDHDAKSSKSPCPILGFSLGPDTDADTNHEERLFSNFQQRDMARLVGKNPRGRTFTLNPFGQIFPGDTSSSGSGAEQHSLGSSSDTVAIGSEDSESSKPQRPGTKDSQVKALRKLSSEGRSFVCLPIWDFERQRWFAYAICWSNTPNRDSWMDGDLHFLRIFGNSIMNALSYLDALTANRTKTTFVSSISHELRSPLHGMLSATNFLQDSTLDRFQREMVDSISNSGRTLLDTVDHVMDFAKIMSLGPQGQRAPLESRSKFNNSDHGGAGSFLSSAVDLAVLIEEVVDTVYMGFTVQHDFVYHEDHIKSSTTQPPNFNTTPKNLATSSRSTHQRGRVRIALQLPHRKNWCVNTQAGAWRRIVMNLVGNALKYTTDGLITIRLDPAGKFDKNIVAVSFVVVDTGKGISNEYLENRLFQPFSQEDSFASGTGLGLSIVDQVSRNMGGKTHVSSTPGAGTNVSVKLTMSTAVKTPSLLSTSDIVDHIPDRVRGLRICFLEPSSESVSEDSAIEKAERDFSKSLSTLLREWFGTKISVATAWSPGIADIVLCPRPSFKQLQSITDSSHVPPVMLITYDALEMAVLQADARISGCNSVVEILSQPIGPCKLARSLEQCLERSKPEVIAQEKERRITLSSNSVTADQNTTSPIRAAIPESPHPPARKHSDPKAAVPGNGPIVLIVDDNKLNLRLLGAFMKKLKIRCREATNGQIAVDMYKEANGSFQCILMDISMPIMDGMTATRMIREFENASRLPKTPVIALTGLTSTAARSEAEEAGMDDFLTKPISFDVLQGVLPNPNEEQVRALTAHVG